MILTFKLRIIWSDCSLQRTEARLWWENWLIIYVICQMCQAQRILYLLIQYHIRFDNGVISWNLGTVNQALTLECEIFKLAAIGNGKLCGYFPLLSLSSNLLPAFMVAKTKSWMSTVQHRFTRFVFMTAKNIAIIFWIWNIIISHVIFIAKDIYFFFCNLYDIMQTDVNCSVVFLFVL